MALSVAEKRVVNSAMKKVDLLLKSVDVSPKDGKLNAAEIGTLQAQASAVVPRKNPSDDERLLNAAMCGMSKMDDTGRDSVSVKEVKTAIRNLYQRGFEAFSSVDKGGLAGGLEVSMYMACMPIAAAPLIAQRLAAAGGD
jgi:hypothetical protein